MVESISELNNQKKRNIQIYPNLTSINYTINDFFPRPVIQHPNMSITEVITECSMATTPASLRSWSLGRNGSVDVFVCESEDFF